MYHKGRTEGG